MATPKHGRLHHDCGNATEAARQAGYKYPNVAGAENIVKHSIQAALSALTEKTANERIADAKERQTPEHGRLHHGQREIGHAQQG